MIPKEVRTEYMALIAGQQVAKIAGFLQELSQVEQQRIDVFFEAEQAPQQQIKLQIGQKTAGAIQSGACWFLFVLKFSFWQGN